MKDEIKEILDYMKEISSFDYTTDWFELDYKDTKILKDYITNLQEENKILKTRNKIIAEDITKDRINCDVIQTVCGIPIEEIPELKLYKSRNEKAIEYIKEHNCIATNKEYKPTQFEYCCNADLLNILNGDDNE